MAGALIGALRVSLSAETSAFEAGMKRSQRTAQRTASSIGSSFSKAGAVAKAGLAGFIGALSIGTVLAAGKAALDYAGSLGEVAQQLGVTTRDLQVFRYAAGQVGVSQEELETGLGKLTITLGKVAAGAKEPAKALNAIGISVEQLKGKDAGEAMRIIADGLQNVTDRSQRAAVEVALFGKSGAKLDNLLSGGSKAINELAAAAEKLGIVLSDEQIQKADDTADKLEALQTVLKAQIAGVVADNAEAILKLADAFADLVSGIGGAIMAWNNFWAAADARKFDALGNRAAAATARGRAYVSGKNPTLPGSSVTIKLGPAKEAKPQVAGKSIGQFLSGGGSAKKDRSAEEAERKRLEALRQANDMVQEQLRADSDILQAKRDLAIDYIEQTTLSVQMLDIERAAYKAQLDYEVAAKDKSKAEADALLLKYDEADSLRRQKLLADEEAQRYEDSARLDQVSFDIKHDELSALANIAETAKERRAIELRILDLAYQQERARLEAVLADKQATDIAKEEARRRLAGLNNTYSADRQNVVNQTRGPWEQWMHDAQNTEEAFESLKVQGVEGVVDSLVGLTEGFDNMRDVALSAIKQIIAQLIRMQLIKAAASIFSAGMGGGGVTDLTGAGGVGSFASTYSGGGIPTLTGLPTFAGGGGFNLLGNRGVDRNLLSMNGLPIARVSYGERINIANDNRSGGMRRGAAPFIFNNYARMSPEEARQTGSQAAAAYNAEIAKARTKGIS